MAHCLSAEAETILDRRFKVLDKGFVRLVDYLGNDERIVSAARVSYGAGTKSFRQDRSLIRYLLRNEHTSPFEQVVMTFHAKMPIFVARQWIRHRTARVNEISGRYSVFSDEFYVPRHSAVAFQSTDNKQGRSPRTVPAGIQRRVVARLHAEQKRLYAGYQKMLGDNIARELARINLPLSLYTEWYWQIDLNNLFHFLRLRLDPHAQMEIRAYADVIARLGRMVCPLAFEAFDDYIIGSICLSRSERDALKAAFEGNPAGCDERSRQLIAEKLGFDPMRGSIGTLSTVGQTFDRSPGNVAAFRTSPRVRARKKTAPRRNAASTSPASTA